MRYVEFMKNFLLPDSTELMAFRLILACCAQKQVIPTLWTWCTSSSWKIFFSPIRASWWLLDSFWHPQPKNKWFLLCRHDVRRVHEKFSSRGFQRADCCKTHFGILSPKTNDSYFVEMMYVEFMKIFFSPIPAIWWLLDSFWPHVPKNKWFLLCRHDVRWINEKFSSTRFEQADGC